MSKIPHATPLLLMKKLYNCPHLITYPALNSIIDYVESRNFGLIPVEKEQQEDEPKRKEVEMFNGVGEIEVNGALTYKPIYGMCGMVGASYVNMLEQASDLIANGAHTIVMSFASPGGEASHCFETADEIHAMCKDAGVRLVSYIDEYAHSAAYAQAVVADEVFINPSASAGSIGAVIHLQDLSKMKEKLGVKDIYISSTPGKVPINDDGTFSESFINKLKGEVVQLGENFAAHVSKYMGLDFDAVLSLDAQVFNAQEALKLGLVNGIKKKNEMLKYLEN